MEFESFVRNQLELYNTKVINIEELKSHLSNELVKDESRAATLNNAINTIVDKYSRNELSEEGVINALRSLENELTNNNTNNNYNNDNPVTDDENGKTEIIDVDTEIIDKLAKEYGIIENEVSSNNIKVPSTITSYAGPIVATSKKGNNEVSKEVDSIKGQMIETIKSLADADSSIVNSDFKNYTFNQLMQAAAKLKMNKLVPAGLDFFKNNPNCKINGNEVTFNQNGNVYKYDLASKTFTCNGSKIKNLGIYVPSGVSNYANLNTFTYFVQGDYDRTTQYPSNAIVIRVIKKEVQSGQKFVKQSAVAGATRFVNAVAKTDLTNCQNIIGGDSVYGAHSLKLAANNGSLYQTVYCVNNAALVTGINAQKGEKEQFSSLSELKKLNGKNIYFISSTGDPNLACHYGNKGILTPCSNDQSYTYTGAKLLAENCPDAKVYAVYGGSKAKAGIKTAYRDLDRRKSNFTYLENDWYSFVKHEYNTHTDGAKLMSDLIGAVTTNVNGHTG